ncbi:hypothetical protein [Vagococcus xieshaowenii]|uniref:Uncharacterized protein n=1 Tax=Vagococcus xieshaowenii TaxID=2562451 RepID=A0AAJ5JMR1_9ENTE|nr:hypothetical protein [Vagococcus xieshaowenii]QCA29708.1 hypothetical protein E4Z98_09995 [Vagococcus xieshaowenii]TFZ42923.1 hypothetical protein E4031_01430 [Vagococcus xieshaowenii]
MGKVCDKIKKIKKYKYILKKELLVEKYTAIIVSISPFIISYLLGVYKPEIGRIHLFTIYLVFLFILVLMEVNNGKNISPKNFVNKQIEDSILTGLYKMYLLFFAIYIMKPEELQDRINKISKIVRDIFSFDIAYLFNKYEDVMISITGLILFIIVLITFMYARLIVLKVYKYIFGMFDEEPKLLITNNRRFRK